MTSLNLVCLIAVFILTAFVSVVTGGTSLITVPVMMHLGMAPHVAVATNMLTLIFLSAGGTIPFLKGEFIPRQRLPWLVALTLVGSILGALLVLAVPAKFMPLVVSVAMIAVVAFSVTRGDAGTSPVEEGPSRALQVGGYVLTFVLGVYSGFFSGGYVTLLTAVFVGCFRMTFLQAVAATKVLNVFSSLVATGIFAVRGLIDWKLGVVLGVASFGGAALERARQRLGSRADSVRWLEADVTAAQGVGEFDLWHDRAVFHFLTVAEDRRRYVELARRTIPPGGHLVIGTFATGGPSQCSGLDVCRYDARSLGAELGHAFSLAREATETHRTPWGSPQEFFFGVFRREA